MGRRLIAQPLDLFGREVQLGTQQRDAEPNALGFAPVLQVGQQVSREVARVIPGNCDISIRDARNALHGGGVGSGLLSH
jgi:hypothetical protein